MGDDAGELVKAVAFPREVGLALFLGGDVGVVFDPPAGERARLDGPALVAQPAFRPGLARQDVALELLDVGVVVVGVDDGLGKAVGLLENFLDRRLDERPLVAADRRRLLQSEIRRRRAVEPLDAKVRIEDEDTHLRVVQGGQHAGLADRRPC